MAVLGVFPVYGLIFKIGTKGLASVDNDMKTISDMETFSPSVDGKVEKWTPMTTSGWERSLMTGKAFSIGLKGKRSIGDLGNDYVAQMAWQDGVNCSTVAQICFLDGAKLTFNCTVDVKTPFGGNSTEVSSLEFDLIGDGKPIYTPAASPSNIALSSSAPVANATSVATTTKPVLTFNSAIADASGITLLNVTDAALVPYTITMDATSKIVTINPTAALVASKTYILTLSDVLDIYGQELAQQIIKFTT